MSNYPPGTMAGSQINNVSKIMYAECDNEEFPTSSVDFGCIFKGEVDVDMDLEYMTGVFTCPICNTLQEINLWSDYDE